MKANTYTAAREALTDTMDEVCRDRALESLAKGKGKQKRINLAA